MKQFTAYLVILLMILLLYNTYESFHIKEGHKVNNFYWHKEYISDGPENVEHSHPIPWATNLSAQKRYRHNFDLSELKDRYGDPESVQNAEKNGYKCSLIDFSDSGHSEHSEHSEHS